MTREDQTNVTIENDETQLLTEALEAINHDAMNLTESKDWKRWHLENGNDGQISPNIEIDESDQAIISPTHNNCAETVSGNNTSDIIDDDSNSTSGVDNGPKDMYEEEEEEDIEQNGHCDIVCADLTNDDDDENGIKENEALLPSKMRNSTLETVPNEIKNAEILNGGDTLDVDEDNNTIIANNCGENVYPTVANGISHPEKLSNELGNGNNKLF